MLFRKYYQETSVFPTSAGIQLKTRWGPGTYMTTPPSHGADPCPENMEFLIRENWPTSVEDCLWKVWSRLEETLLVWDAVKIQSLIFNLSKDQMESWSGSIWNFRWLFMETVRYHRCHWRIHPRRYPPYLTCLLSILLSPFIQQTSTETFLAIQLPTRLYSVKY